MATFVSMGRLIYVEADMIAKIEAREESLSIVYTLKDGTTYEKLLPEDWIVRMQAADVDRGRATPRSREDIFRQFVSLEVTRAEGKEPIPWGKRK